MADDRENGPGNPMYDALMRLRPPGLSLNQWATRAGINRSIFNAIRAHGNPTMVTLDKLLGAIDRSHNDLQALLSPVRTEVRGTGMSPSDAAEAWRIPEPAKPVPLVGSAFGGEWEEGIEMTELHLAEVLDYLGRPPSLVTDNGAYAVEIVGDSMAPRFEPGERAFVSPKVPVRPGDDVIVQLKGVGEDQLADRVTMVLIKRLVRRTPKYVELVQFNPPSTFQVPVDRIAAIHRVRGRL